MKYDITTNKAPEMPNLGKGTEFKFRKLKNN